MKAQPVKGWSYPTLNWQHPKTKQPDPFRDACWCLNFLPRGAWWTRDGKVVLFNGGFRTLLVHCPKRGLYRPNSTLFERSWEKWDGPLYADIRPQVIRPPFDVVHERRFYDASKAPPWVDSPASNLTFITIMTIIIDFMDGKMPPKHLPERGGAK